MGIIASVDDIVAAMTQRSQHLILSKSSLSNQVAGQPCSLWQVGALPAQPSIPGAAAICSNATPGSLALQEPIEGQELHIARVFLVSGNTGTDVQVWDRLAHMGGLSGTATTVQTVNVDVSGTANNLAARRGAANFQDVLWFLEWYTDTGSTARNLTVNYTLDSDATGSVVVNLGATTRRGRMFPIIPSEAGQYIKSVQSVQWDASTGSAGNFGVTAQRRLTTVALGLANSGETADWAMLGLPRVHAEACLALSVICGTTSSGTLQGGVQLIGSDPFTATLPGDGW